MAILQVNWSWLTYGSLVWKSWKPCLHMVNHSPVRCWSYSIGTKGFRVHRRANLGVQECIYICYMCNDLLVEASHVAKFWVSVRRHYQGGQQQKGSVRPYRNHKLRNFQLLVSAKPSMELSSSIYHLQIWGLVRSLLQKKLCSALLQLFTEIPPKPSNACFSVWPDLTTAA